MKFTLERIQQFKIEALKYQENNKLGYAIKKVLKRIDKISETVGEELEDLRIELCSTDEKGNVLRDEKGNYLFTKEALRSLNKKVKELDKKEYFLEPYFATEVPNFELTEAQIEAFEGIVIKTPVTENV